MFLQVYDRFKMKTFVIAEIGSNWEGSIQKAEKIIKECKKAGADAVKFQMWRANDLYKKSHPNWNEISNSELTFDKAKQIKNARIAQCNLQFSVPSQIFRSPRGLSRYQRPMQPQ